MCTWVSTEQNKLPGVQTDFSAQTSQLNLLCDIQSWSPGARSPCSVLHNDFAHHSWTQLHFPYSPIASQLLGWWHAVLDSPLSWESILTFPMEKIATWPKCWLPYTSVRIISLKTYFFGQQGKNTVLFLSFLSKNLYLIHVNSLKQDWTMDSTWAQQLPINGTYAGSKYMTWQAGMFRWNYKQTIKITAIWEPARDYLDINHFE